ncbi:MAG: BatD family protein [Bacteroidota bacterium]
MNVAKALKYILGLCFMILLSFFNRSLAQEIKIELGPSEVASNQAWTITVTVSNGRLRSYDKFPEINEFQQRGTSSSSSTNIINGQISSSQSITMNYAPTQEGEFQVPSFTMEINGKQVSAQGKTIKVGPPLQRQSRRRRGNDPFGDPFEDFFGRNKPKEYVEVEDDAFFALTVDKEEVYLGEGFNTTLSFYVPQNSRAPLQFYETGKQLTEILKKIKPSNCWEENFNIDNINGEMVQLKDKAYNRYKIYQATFYPLTLEDIEFPSVSLEMIKYKVAKNPSFFGRNRQQDFKTFYTRPRTVKVNELPAHPLKDQVAVGNFWLDEKINSGNLKTGDSFNYVFEIKGEGNISAVDKPDVDSDEYFDFYDPNIRQNIRRSNNRVMGSKSFSYFGIPNEPGEFDLGKYFEWIYFDPYEEQYDTLKSEVVLNVTGESRRNEYISSNDMGSFYDGLEFKNNELKSFRGQTQFQIISNIIILILLVATAWVIFKK